MPRKKFVPLLIAEPKRPKKSGDVKPLVTRQDGDTALAWGRWHQLHEAKIVPASLAEPTDRSCNYSFKDAKGRTVKVKPYATHMWWVAWPNPCPAPVEQPPAPDRLLNGRDPNHKMRWFKDRSVWTHEMHFDELKERIAQCEEDDDDPSYWQRELSRYMASLRK